MLLLTSSSIKKNKDSHTMCSIKHKVSPFYLSFFGILSDRTMGDKLSSYDDKQNQHFCRVNSLDTTSQRFNKSAQSYRANKSEKWC